jgi:hypothetical protein
VSDRSNSYTGVILKDFSPEGSCAQQHNLLKKSSDPTPARSPSFSLRQQAAPGVLLYNPAVLASLHKKHVLRSQSD